MLQRILRKYDFLMPIDILVQGYFLVLSLLLIFFHNGLSNWWVYILAHIAVVYLLFVFIQHAHRSTNKIMQLVRYAYPILLYTFMYEEVNGLVHVIFPNWLDSNVYNVEYALLGFHPTALLDKIKSPLVTEFFKISYFSYYWIVFVPALYLFFAKRKNALIDYVETISIAYYICYIGFILFPVRGPRYELMYFHPEPLTGYIITPIQDFIMKVGSMYGGCMPSSHVAAAWVSVAMMKRYLHKVYYPMMIVVIFLSISTVYCRYHYVLDVVAGFIVFLIALYIKPLFNEYLFKVKYGIKKSL